MKNIINDDNNDNNNDNNSTSKKRKLSDLNNIDENSNKINIKNIVIERPKLEKNAYVNSKNEVIKKNPLSLMLPDEDFKISISKAGCHCNYLKELYDIFGQYVVSPTIICKHT